MHDSLCRHVNNTLLSREKVQVKKVWAPDMRQMDEALDQVNAKVVVLESWTRDLSTMNVEEMNQRMDEVITKALTKAEKVVISTIVNREDVAGIGIKVGLVNAHIILTYTENKSVVVCDNSTLQSREFRYDKLHLKVDGVRIFASNLKHAIAEALGVRVMKKKTNRYNRRRHEYEGNEEDRWERDDNHYRYRGARW